MVGSEESYHAQGVAWNFGATGGHGSQMSLLEVIRVTMLTS